MTTPLPIANGPPGGPPAGLDLGSTFGVMLLSTIIITGLYGFTVLQTLYYYEKFPRDGWLVKTAVAALWVLDTLTVALDCHAIYFYLITNYNNPPALQLEIWSTQVELLITYTIVLIVQIFFLHRMYHLRPHLWYIPGFLAVVAVASYAMVVVIFTEVSHDKAWADTDRPAVTKPLQANWILGMVVDIGITVILCWYLWSEKGGLRRKTNVMLNQIIVFLVHRGAIAAVVQVLTLLTKFIWPQTLVWIAFHNALSKVYTNSMLATLNARISLRKIVMDSELDATMPETGRPAVSHVPVPRTHPAMTLQFAPNSAFDSPERTTDHEDPYAAVRLQSSRNGNYNYNDDKYGESFMAV